MAPLPTEITTSKTLRRPDLEAAVLALQPGDDEAFRALSTEIRAYQRAHSPVSAAFGDACRYLPIAAFREADVTCFEPGLAEATFLSSGTTRGPRARHHMLSLDWYERVSLAGFERLIGPDEWRVVGCLPAYAPDSSLVRMVEHFGRAYAGGRLIGTDRALLAAELEEAEHSGQRILLIGAAFGLLDLVASGPVPLPESALLIETGGMKTHRRALTRGALHQALQQGFGSCTIGSEYGMTELTSQAWAPRGGLFQPPPWVRMSIVDPLDPDRGLPGGTAGALAVEDLANLYSASFLVTEDLATERDGGFEVLGRLSGRDLRGCNHLMEHIDGRH